MKYRQVDVPSDYRKLTHCPPMLSLAELAAGK
jgi:hypothetical protein